MQRLKDNTLIVSMLSFIAFVIRTITDQQLTVNFMEMSSTLLTPNGKTHVL